MLRSLRVRPSVRTLGLAVGTSSGRRLVLVDERDRLRRRLVVHTPLEALIDRRAQPRNRIFRGLQHLCVVAELERVLGHRLRCTVTLFSSYTTSQMPPPCQR